MKRGAIFIRLRACELVAGEAGYPTKSATKNRGDILASDTQDLCLGNQQGSRVVWAVPRGVSDRSGGRTRIAGGDQRGGEHSGHQTKHTLVH